jgi:hypothetical protein
MPRTKGSRQSQAGQTPRADLHAVLSKRVAITGLWPTRFAITGLWPTSATDLAEAINAKFIVRTIADRLQTEATRRSSNMDIVAASY